QSDVGKNTRLVNSAKEREILDCRLGDPEMTMSEIAKKTRLHRNTVASHWNGLWKKKVLLKKTVVINPAYFGVLGIDFKALVLFDASMGKVEKTIDYLMKFKEVHELTSIAYHNDVLGIVRMRDLYSAYRFIKNVYAKDFISATETYPVFIAYTKKVEPI
ncbi:Lrp/AsnC family transcriptional regulator, partial [Candidatus Micrarchaeota archaeon]|nr:Lrp/AsnC family transcriptional regulator [Candidatus Micrarchaeota archaeon]